jgi:multiple sugar transport system permease protein
VSGSQRDGAIQPNPWKVRTTRGGWHLTERRREALAGILFAGPWLIGLLCLTTLPTLASFVFSFTDYEVVRWPPRFVGLHNYVRLFTDDPRFVKALLNTLFIVALGVPTQMVAGLLLALLLNQKVGGLGIYRTFFFLPSQITGVSLALMWGWILNPQFGVVSYLLDLVGVRSPLWFTDPTWVKPAFVVMGLWAVGTSMIIWLAGLQSIPDLYYEAAQIDGAGKLGRFWHITMPLLTPTTFFTLITSVIYTFQVFTQAYVLTKGGPNDASLFYALYVFEKAFKVFQMGYASSLAWVLFAVIMALTLLNLKLSKSWVYYEAEKT